MAQQPPVDFAIGAHDHGLRFLNEQWNDSISNGQPFILKWNQSLAKSSPRLGLFKIRYPKDGIVAFDMVSNLTGPIDSVSYEWTPNYLGDNELYTVWLSDGQPVQSNWTASPPWTPKVSRDMGWKRLTDPTEPAIIVESRKPKKPDNEPKLRPSIWLILPSRVTSSIMTQELPKEETASGTSNSRTCTLVSQSSV
ncbi:hypothetical protein E4U21_004470 [Claviceps maximensis]|nr:hypothetical protein E4U21_004470 [Claviceps maximensis]